MSRQSKHRTTHKYNLPSNVHWTKQLDLHILLNSQDPELLISNPVVTIIKPNCINTVIMWIKEILKLISMPIQSKHRTNRKFKLPLKDHWRKQLDPHNHSNNPELTTPNPIKPRTNHKYNLPWKDRWRKQFDPYNHSNYPRKVMKISKNNSENSDLKLIRLRNVFMIIFTIVMRNTKKRKFS